MFYLKQEKMDCVNEKMKTKRGVGCYLWAGMKTLIAIRIDYEDCCLICVQVYRYYSLLQGRDCAFQLKQVVSEHP